MKAAGIDVARPPGEADQVLQTSDFFDLVLAMDGDLIGHVDMARIRYRFDDKNGDKIPKIKIYPKKDFLEKKQISVSDVHVLDALAGLDLLGEFDC